jgi:hypothetical protein
VSHRIPLKEGKFCPCRSDLVQELQPRPNWPWVPPKLLCNVGQRSFPQGSEPAGQELKHLDQIFSGSLFLTFYVGILMGFTLVFNKNVELQRCERSLQ